MLLLFEKKVKTKIWCIVAGLIDQNLEGQKSICQINRTKKRSKSLGRNSEGKLLNAFDGLPFLIKL